MFRITLYFILLINILMIASIYDLIKNICHLKYETKLQTFSQITYIATCIGQINPLKTKYLKK